MRLVVTGGRGFIGSHFVEDALELGHTVYDIDKMGYASHEKLPWDSNPNYKLQIADISTLIHIPTCDILVNFAAESHVDNSIRDSKPFVDSSLIGVWNLLELIRGKPEYGRPLFFISAPTRFMETGKMAFSKKMMLYLQAIHILQPKRGLKCSSKHIPELMTSTTS